VIDLHALNVVVHVAAGVVALIVGVVPLVARKGGIPHRRFGRVFVGVGAVVLIAAAFGDVFYGAPPALVGATIAAGYGYLSGLRALALRAHGPTGTDAALAVAGIVGCAFLLVFMGPGTASWTPAIGYSTVGYVATLAVYDLSRFAWSRAWLAHARPLDHGLKMTGAYFGMMSAGFGNLFPDAQPWSQVGPTGVGFLAMAILAAVFVTGHRRSHRERVPLSRA